MPPVVLIRSLPIFDCRLPIAGSAASIVNRQSAIGNG
jgi:hypothetical protein